MTTTKIPSLNQYWAKLAAKLPSFSPEEQRAAVALYRELAKGQPIDAAQLGQALGVSAAEGRALLARDSIRTFVYPDKQGRVLGFGGLATAPMHHRFEVDGRRLYTWCAWDSLFIPEILGTTAWVTSADPVTKEKVSLIVGPTGVTEVSPASTVVSFLTPETPFDADVIQNFCHFVHFFGSPETAAQWTAKRKTTFLLSVAEAFELGRLTNRRNFG